MLIAMVFAVLALALGFPETRIGGALRRLVIEAPARRLNGLKRGHVLLVLLVFAVLAAAYAIGRQEGVALIGQATADTLANSLAIDLATWLDVTAIAVIAAAAVRLREVMRLAAALARRWARRCAGRLAAAVAPPARGRARRTRAIRPRRPGEDPDGPVPAFA